MENRDRKNFGGYKDQSYNPRFLSGFDSRWIKEKINKSGIQFAENVGSYLADKMTTSQIRNFFGEVKRIQMKGFDKEETAFLLLKPKLAYSVVRNISGGGDKREKEAAMKEFQEIMNRAHDAVEPGNNAQFENFVNLLEAILAYHKANNGK